MSFLANERSLKEWFLTQNMQTTSPLQFALVVKLDIVNTAGFSELMPQWIVDGSLN